MVTLMLTPPPPENLVNTGMFYFCTPHLFFVNPLLKFHDFCQFIFTYYINLYRVFFILFLIDIIFLFFL